MLPIQAPQAPFLEKPLPQPPLEPDGAHPHEHTRRVIPEGPLASRGSGSLPAHPSEISSQPAEDRTGSRSMKGDSEEGRNVPAPRTAYQQGLALPTRREIFQEGTPGSCFWPVRDHVGGNVFKATHTRRKLL